MPHAGSVINRHDGFSSAIRASSTFRGPAPAWLITALAPFTEHLRTQGSGVPTVQYWHFESRYFSSIIHCTLRVDGNDQEFIAKFPKAERRRRFDTLPKRLPEDVELAKHEFQALAQLSHTWPQGETAFVEPVHYDASSGMLVFRRLSGQNVYSRSLPYRLLWKSNLVELTQALKKTGRALATYHTANGRARKVDVERVLLKTRKIIGEVEAETGAWPDSASLRDDIMLVPSIRGFEIRNMMVTREKVFLYDPGRLREEPPEADIARFIVSVKMVGWGTQCFMVPLDTSTIESAFVEAYEERRSIDRGWLAVLTARELAWNWRECRAVVNGRAWSGWMRSLASRLYVDLGFKGLWRRAVLTEEQFPQLTRTRGASGVS